jgi:hypothetical protein
VAQLPGGNKDCIKQLMDLQVPCLDLMEDLAQWGLARLSPWARASRAPGPLDPKGPLRSGTRDCLVIRA